jgi:hypothetical protein
MTCRCYRVAPGVFVRVVDCPVHLASGYRLPYLAAPAARAKPSRAVDPVEKAGVA